MRDPAPTAHKSPSLEDRIVDQSHIPIRKGEIWDVDAGRFKVVHVTAKTVKLRRLSHGRR